MLVRRLAHEIEQRLRGGKVRDAGLLPDGRPALAIWSRGTTFLLCLDLFGTPPLVTLEPGELPIAAEPGFIRALATTLRGMALLAAKSRREDRLLRLTFGTRSRFGVGDEVELYVELVPRFGNAILVKGGVTIAAMKEFSLAENGTRAILAGQPYALPPLLRRNHAAASTAVPDETQLNGPVFVTHAAGGGIERIALTPGDGETQAIESLLDAFAAYRLGRIASGDDRASQRKRASLRKRLDDREKKLRRELAAIDEKTSAADGRDDIKLQGEAIFATLHDLPEEQRNDAVERAQKLFARYKKLGASLPHLETRRETVNAGLRAIDELRWEAGRASDDELADVEAAIDESEGKRNARTASAPKRRRKPLEVRTPNGSRILVGRTPVENADLTFKTARPNDLWFHAQNIPGAHVIVQRDDRDAPNDEDIAAAASYAAGYSKARESALVPVDYTFRKNVRKQKDAAPGLVWYTNFKTVTVTPKQINADSSDSPR